MRLGASKLMVGFAFLGLLATYAVPWVTVVLEGSRGSSPLGAPSERPVSGDEFYLTYSEVGTTRSAFMGGSDESWARLGWSLSLVEKGFVLAFVVAIVAYAVALASRRDPAAAAPSVAIGVGGCLAAALVGAGFIAFLMALGDVARDPPSGVSDASFAFNALAPLFAAAYLFSAGAFAASAPKRVESTLMSEPGRESRATLARLIVEARFHLAAIESKARRTRDEKWSAWARANAGQLDVLEARLAGPMDAQAIEEAVEKIRRQILDIHYAAESGP